MALPPPTVVVDDITYNPTTVSNAILLSDDAFGLADVISKLTESVNRLVERL